MSKHKGTSPALKSNGYPSTILVTCDVCSAPYDPMWREECPGAPYTTVELLERRRRGIGVEHDLPKGGLKRSPQQQIWDLEKRVKELERLHGIDRTSS